ncbi:LmbU family transcriptional regulator [Lentzea rhizosphaerae]|uniref:LmbU family transcriptional regulator n=1 Tax=Lentzea rhizosphaerae TaxID=2041025 RepID=A0ABV8C7Y1_9PSEU
MLPDLPAVDGVEIRSNGLLLPQGMPFGAWECIGQFVLNAAESVTWWIGDLLVYGQDAFGDRYEQAIARTSLDYQTLRNYAWIAKKFPVSRRRDKLSFGHHSEVAALVESEQDVWLERAERLGWSRNELRRRLRAARNARLMGGTEQRQPLTQAVNLQVSVRQHERWREAAEQMNCSIDHWIVETLDEAAGIRSE